jgi:UDP-GlcNAc:undecaprenyl-phosphate GlcNAc-1-phosphate transferase
MTIITVLGLIDDVMGIDPRAKIAGQLIAAGALAYTHVGTNVAAGFVLPIADTLGIPMTHVNGQEMLLINLPGLGPFGSIDVVYWTGTAIIAVFVIGGCNAANLVDGLDGLLTGVTSIAAGGLLVLALGLALADNGSLDAARIVLCLALLGATLGFLPHNFNPAVIFLGDCGSMLLGFMTVVIILTLGDTGFTHLVIAGLIIYAIPIIDTTLAIFRRKIAGRAISAADDQHLHHMLRRAVGVKGAVFVLYGIAAGFAVMGVVLSLGRGRVTYALVLVLAAFIGVTALKIARRDHIEEQALGGRKPDAGRSAAEDNGAATGEVDSATETTSAQ